MGAEVLALIPFLLGSLSAAAALLWPGTVCLQRRRERPRGRRRPDQDSDRSLTVLLRERWQAAITTSGERARRSAEEAALLDAVAAGLDAGLPVPQALLAALEAHDEDRIPPRWDELGRAAAEGQPLAPVWSRVARRTRSQTAASVARAWEVASTTGAPLAEAARSSAAAARERRRLLRAVGTATAGARASVLVLSLLPVVGVGMAALVGIGPAELYGDQIALTSALVGLTFLGAGHLIVQRMLGRVTGGLR